MEVWFRGTSERKKKNRGGMLNKRQPFECGNWRGFSAEEKRRPKPARNDRW